MDDFDPMRKLRLDADPLAEPGLLHQLERHLWLELWRAPGVAAVEGEGIETRFYGPVQAHVIAASPETPLLNVVLGAAEPGAVEDGHLVEALDWIESLGVDCRILVRPGFEESGAAEDHLNRRGYRRTAFLVRFGRDASPPGFPEPPGIEIDEWTEEKEGFSDYFAEGLDLSFPADHVFDCLPGRRPWRCYVAVDEEEEGAGAAIMLMHFQIAQLVFSVTRASARGRGIHMALLRRRILDAAAAGSRVLFADAEEPLDDPDGPSRATRNLLRAGFKQLSAQPVWRPPE
jgi:GNAT superfamily N-acetyltransferase